MEAKFEDSIEIGPRAVAQHVDYWTKIDDIAHKLGKHVPHYRTDEEFEDAYGSELDFFYRSLCYNDEVITKLKEYENRAE